jgi:hypothetical protein
MLSKLKILPALAAIAGGTVFSLGLASAPAQAACGTVTLAFLAAGGSVACGDKLFEGFSSLDFAPLSATTTVEFTELNPLDYKVSFIFGDVNNPNTGLGTGIYSPVYFVKVLDPTKSIIGYNTQFTASGDVGSIISALTLTDQFDPTLATYQAESELEVGASTKVQVWSHFYSQTPGPLPILGAGAAFGFSRKLRRRIKSVV